MTMKNEERLIEVMADLLAEVHEMRTDTKKQLNALNTTVDKLSVKFDRLEKNVSTMNIQLAENTRARMKIADFNDRIIELERAVFKKAG